MGSNKALIWKSFDLWSLITRFYSPFPLRWDRKLKLFKELEGKRLKLIPWLVTLPLVFIPFIFGSILFFMQNIQEGRSSSGNVNVFTFYLEVIVALGVLVMSCLGCAMVIVYFLYGKQLLLSFNYIKELHEQLLRRSTNNKSSRSSEKKERKRKGLAVALIIAVLYTLGISPHAVVIQLTYMNFDPWYVLLKATGQGDILDPKNYGTSFYWIYLLVKLFRGYVFWVGLCEVLRMTMLYSLIGLVLPIMLNDCIIFIQKECDNNNAGAFDNRIVMMNCIRSSIKTRRYMKIYKELQIVIQSMAQAQALASTGILSAVFIVTVFGNFIVVRLSDLLPVYFSVNTVIGLCSSAFSVNLSMKV
jgi:hypothetical protein